VAPIDQARDVDARVVDHRNVIGGHAGVADADGGRDDHDHRDENDAEDDRQVPLREESAVHRGGSIAVVA
jgi:hypothetical protein